MPPKNQSCPKDNEKACQTYHGADAGRRNQGSSNNATNRPQNGKKKKKRTKNDTRQIISQNREKDEKDRVKLGKSEVLLAATDEFPYIKIDETAEALDFAKTAHTSNYQLVLFVDGSCSACPRDTAQSPPTSSRSFDTPPSSRSPSPTSSSTASGSREYPGASSKGVPTPPPSPTSAFPAPLGKFNGGTSVVYEENNEYVCNGFSLPYIQDAQEAEMRGIEQGFAVALERVQSRKKIIVLTDCQPAMRQLAKHLTGKDDQSTVVATAASNARELRRLGVDVELRWVPGHMAKKYGIRANNLADIIAKNANAYTRNLSNARARELAGRVHKMEKPYLQRPRV